MCETKKKNVSEVEDIHYTLEFFSCLRAFSLDYVLADAVKVALKVVNDISRLIVVTHFLFTFLCRFVNLSDHLLSRLHIYEVYL